MICKRRLQNKNFLAVYIELEALSYVGLIQFDELEI